MRNVEYQHSIQNKSFKTSPPVNKCSSKIDPRIRSGRWDPLTEPRRFPAKNVAITGRFRSMVLNIPHFTETFHVRPSVMQE